LIVDYQKFDTYNINQTQKRIGKL